MAIIEQRTYQLKPEFTPKDYFDLYESQGRSIQTEILQGLVGYFSSEVGELNTVQSLWRYPSFEIRMQRRAQLASNPHWQAFLINVRPMLLHMENRLLTPAVFSPLQ